MLTFKTQFPLRSDVEMENFMGCCKDWIAGSPHSLLSRAITSSQEYGRFEVDGEAAEFLHVNADGKEVGGVRYEKTDAEGVHWSTDVVACRSEQRFSVSVQLSVDSDIPVENLGKGRRPYIVKLLMERFGGGMDGPLPVHDLPIDLTEDQQELAADLICARTASLMPVVYVSRRGDGTLAVNAAQLATWVSAMAHVVVEPSRAFSTELSREVYGENPYGGALAIFWPDGVGRWLYLPERWESEVALQGAIARKIRTSLLFQRTQRECTWAFLVDAIARQKFEAIRQSGAGKLEDYIAHFDKEVAENREEIRRLESELNRVRFTRSYTDVAESSSTITVDVATTERDLYQGEHLSVILEALGRASESAEENSRRRHILDALIASNKHEGEREIILAKLKDVLSQYESMTPGVRKELETLGFEVRDDGKHYKLIFRKDERFPFVLSRTSSDWRAGKNAVADLRKKLF